MDKNEDDPKKLQENPKSKVLLKEVIQYYKKMSAMESKYNTIIEYDANIITTKKTLTYDTRHLKRAHRQEGYVCQI